MDKRILKFRPFRRVGDKLVVTSYTGWYKIFTANYEGAIVKLLPFPTVKKGEVVYSMHDPNGAYNYWYPTKFEPLFWPVNAVIRHIGYGEHIYHLNEPGVVISNYNSDDGLKENEVYSMFDCAGCPRFSHITSIYVSENYGDKIHLFEPLTADIVYKYFEKMRDMLDKIEWLSNT